ncbi:unnamed protein product [Candidula unifasciata]|uniref:Major facilitator superfamily (MFS) profile domain-containing protein n=1 Tax=Candidula unifasciata TaxID=100452 RepID=A0A8S3Z1Q9_9EUPU|nr:unnamed protein product [Candidula unifasciata]
MSDPIYKTVPQELPVGDKQQQSTGGKQQDEGDTRCGFWIYRPAYMQPLARIGVFAAFYSLANMLTNTLTFYVNSQITTLERQFGFSSHQTGIIMAANDVGFLVFVLFAAHLATRTHIPRSLAITTIVFGISGIFCSLPHFLFGASVNKDPTTDNSTESNFSKQSAVAGSFCDIFNISGDPCGINTAQNTAGQKDQTTSEKVSEISFVIIVLGMTLQGFGKAPRLSYSLLYLDDNTKKVNTGFYAGIMSAAAVLGPVAAFLLGGVFSRMYVTLEATQLTPRHPSWIGAWWLGFVVFGLLAVIAAIPLFCFPRKLPRNKVKDAPLTQKTPAGLNAIEDRCAISPEFVASLSRLAVNPVYGCLVVSSCFHIFMAAGSTAFYPKYLERVFHLGIHTANYITGGTLAYKY